MFTVLLRVAERISTCQKDGQVKDMQELILSNTVPLRVAELGTYAT